MGKKTTKVSYLMAHKFRMEAVHIQTSTASHMEHQISPKIHTPKISHVAENGSTKIPTIRSATAKDTINKFVTVRSLVLMNTARMTKQLPTITTTLMKARITKDTMTLASLHSNSGSGSHSVDRFMPSRFPSIWLPILHFFTRHANNFQTE